jgi:uncharacterized protein (UPF0147 family)
MNYQITLAKAAADLPCTRDALVLTNLVEWSRSVATFLHHVERDHQVPHNIREWATSLLNETDML